MSVETTTDKKLGRKAWRRSFRNYLFNDLGLSRGDIEGMLREIVREEVKQLIGPNLDELIMREVHGLVQSKDRYGFRGGLTQDKIESTRKAVEKAIIDDAVAVVGTQLGKRMNVSLTLEEDKP